MKHPFAARAAVLVASLVAAAPFAAQAQVVYDSADNIWYEAVYTGTPDPTTHVTGTTWNTAAAEAAALGGFLATPMNESQNDFVFSLVKDPKYWTDLSINSDRLGPWLGIYSTTTGSENFLYSGSGTALGAFQNFHSGQPDGYGGGLQAVDFYDGADIGPTWGDSPQGGVTGFDLPNGFVVQFSAAPVPESSNLAMMLTGLLLAGGLAAARRKR